jgi:uncharacterized short protein YbdD (DUF466 family)
VSDVVIQGIGRALMVLLMLAILLWLLRQGWATLRHFTGDDAYERYCARHRAHGHGGPPLSRKEYWRRKIDDRGDGPRCC